MSYDEHLAERVRKRLETHDNYKEIKMFGGLCFLLNGNMACGIADDQLMVRVGTEQYEDALTQPFARPMEFTGRPMRGIVFVEPAGFEADSALDDWVQRATTFVLTLPPKEAGTKKSKKRAAANRQQ